jgi:hypothetical protein
MYPQWRNPLAHRHVRASASDVMTVSQGSSKAQALCHPARNHLILLPLRRMSWLYGAVDDLRWCACFTRQLRTFDFKSGEPGLLRAADGTEIA